MHKRWRVQDWVFGSFRLSQGLLAVASFCTVMGNITMFSIDKRPPFAPVVWATLPLSIVTIVYAILSSIIHFGYGGWHYIFYHKSINNPLLFAALGSVLDLCLAGVYGATLYVQAGVDGPGLDVWVVRFTTFDCNYLPKIFALFNAQEKPDEVLRGQGIMRNRCRGFIALFVICALTCFDLVLFAGVRLFFTKPAKPASTLRREHVTVGQRRKPTRIVGP